jgi:hypothetical protein
MNRYDMLVLVLELGHSAGLAHELPLDGRKAILILGRRRANQSIDAFAHLGWETFLDHNQPVQTVACHIGYAKTAALKLLFDHILPVQKSHTNAQCIGRFKSGRILVRLSESHKVSLGVQVLAEETISIVIRSW